MSITSEKAFEGFSDSSDTDATMRHMISAKGSMENLKRERDRVVKSLTRIDTFLSRYEENDFAEVAPRLDLLCDRWKEFQEVARKIDEKENSEVNEELYGTVEDQVMSMKGQLQRMLNERDSKLKVKQDLQSGEPDNFRLSRLTLPEFSGKYEEWLPYHDMFLVTVHKNEKLSLVEKMLYLKRSLKGEALKVIAALPACGANYEIAWAALKKRYANEYLLKKRHVNAMLQCPRIKVMNTVAIHGLVDCFEGNLETLSQLGESTDQWGMLLTQIIVSKLDEKMQDKWERHVEESGEKAVNDLLNFLRTQTRIMDASAVDKPLAGGKINSERRVASMVATEDKCIHCSELHLLENCNSFRVLTLPQRREVVSLKKICLNCLKIGHFQAKCWSRTRCHRCNRKHHFLLHDESNESSTMVTVRKETPAAENVVANASSERVDTSTLLCTAVNIRTSGNRWLPARALIDSGSQVNLMTSNLATRLKLPRFQSNIVLTGIGGSKAESATTVQTNVRSRNQSYEEKMQFLVLPKILCYRSAAAKLINRQNLPKNFVLADPEFDSDAEVDLLFGAEFYAEFLKPDVRGNLSIELPSLPTFMSTVFGWVAIGKVSAPAENDRYASCGACIRLEDLIERFWTIEEAYNTPIRTPEENDCEAHFVQHHYRDSEGTYVVKLPLKGDVQSQLGESEAMARKRFMQLERRFNRDECLKQQYSAVIDDYIKKGFLLKIDPKPSYDEGHNYYYLPHHPVIKTSSDSTKIRPVFDGSAQTDSGKSLNDLLMTGPVIQDNLLTLLLRFRLRAIALVADIKQMYLQVKVHPDCTSLQRILWRSTPNEALGCYELQRVTFGLTPSSFLAIRVLHQLASDEGDRFPLAKQALKEDFYVDDYIGGASTEEEATRLQVELTMLLKAGGFHITKWNCNKVDVLRKVPVEDRAISKVKMFEAAEEPVKTLGIAWLTESDQLYIDTARGMSNENWTRRRVYSLVARIYDPLGLVAPVTAWAKINMQALWLATRDWDEEIPDELNERWNAFHSQLAGLKDVKFSRRAVVSNPVAIQLHCFSDASEAAYGTCIYMRSIDSDGGVVVELLAAKSRPAPLKRVSLARLELCGALLAARLQKVVREAIKHQEVETFMWTDATIVLHWIRAPSYSWATYIANRVSEIQELTHGFKWMHVRGTDNPADIVSRGAMPKELLTSELWFHGPAWLQHQEDQWNTDDVMVQPEEGLLERRKRAIVFPIHAEKDDWCDRFSTYERLLRVTAYCLRFVSRCRRKSNRCDERVLSLSEITAAKTILVRREQRINFEYDIKELLAGRPLRPRSSLKTLGAFLDDDGLLRVGGRLNRARCMSQQKSKHPLAISKKSRMSRLIAEYYHRTSLHGGPTMTLSSMRREYWAVQGRSLVNSVCRSCPVCYRMNPTLVQQPSGQLPISRMTPARPFSTVGVDFCGPIYMKPVHRRAAAEKAYIAIFVCFAVKAVHIELVESLSTEAFLASFRRFVARRGMPNDVYSDNGLNFQGGRKVIDEYFAMLHRDSSMESLSNYAADVGVRWHFSPPYAPNFGGLWEAAVKAAKRVLLKVIGTRQLAYGEMATVLAQVEAQLNSRPLTPLSEDPGELDVLTPGHFLIGTPMNALPEPDVIEIPANRLRGYHAIRQIIQNHWKRWRMEYFSELHNEHQRRKTVIPLKVGQMVLLKEDTKTPHYWPLGRITEIFPGPDGIVRVVNVRTKGGTYKRPASKISLLPFENVM